MTFPTLQTTRLLLREIVPADAPALLAIHGNANVMRWYGNDPLPDLAAAEALVERFASWRRLPAPGTRFGLARQEAPEQLIGTAGLFGWNPGWRKCTLGYELAPEAQGQGLMREALLTLLDWGFAAMNLNRIEAQVHPDNASSLKQVRQLGFVEEGRLRQVGFWGAQFHDLLQFGLLKADWDALQLRA